MTYLNTAQIAELPLTLWRYWNTVVTIVHRNIMIIVPHIPIIIIPDTERNSLTIKCKVVFKELEVIMIKVTTAKKTKKFSSGGISGSSRKQLVTEELLLTALNKLVLLAAVIHSEVLLIIFSKTLEWLILIVQSFTKQYSVSLSSIRSLLETLLTISLLHWALTEV